MTIKVHKVVTQEESPNQRAAAQIRAFMAARRRTSADLAVKLGVSAPTVNKKLHGDAASPFNLDEIQVIADWLGVPIAHIIDPVQGLSYSPR